jgi:hypothetical protein
VNPWHRMHGYHDHHHRNPRGRGHGYGHGNHYAHHTHHGFTAVPQHVLNDRRHVRPDVITPYQATIWRGGAAAPAAPVVAAPGVRGGADRRDTERVAALPQPQFVPPPLVPRTAAVPAQAPGATREVPWMRGGAAVAGAAAVPSPSPGLTAAPGQLPNQPGIVSMPAVTTTRDGAMVRQASPAGMPSQVPSQVPSKVPAQVPTQVAVPMPAPVAAPHRAPDTTIIRDHHDGVRRAPPAVMQQPVPQPQVVQQPQVVPRLMPQPQVMQQPQVVQQPPVMAPRVMQQPQFSPQQPQFQPRPAPQQQPARPQQRDDGDDRGQRRGNQPVFR